MSHQHGENDLLNLLKELAFAGFVAFFLAFPIITLRLVDNVQGLRLEQRWLLTTVFVVLVVAGRAGLFCIALGKVRIVGVAAAVFALLGLWAWFYAPPALAFPGLMTLMLSAVLLIRASYAVVRGRSKRSLQEVKARNDERLKKILSPLSLSAIIFAFILPFLPFSNRYVVDTATLIMTYMMLGWGLNVIVGYAGLLDLGYVAFYAVGAYSYALCAQWFNISFWVAMPLAGFLAACCGLLLGFPVLRLRGDYFAIVTLGFGEIIRIILINWYDVTKGPDGLAGIPRPSFFGLASFSREPKDGLPAFHEMFGLTYSTEHRIIFLYYIILVLALMVAAFTLRIRNLPVGRAWEALREDEIACASLGIDRTKIKLAAFTISAAWGGVAGSFFATRQGFISPESFTFIESAIILVIVVLGGMGSLFGIAIAAVALIGLPELFRELAQFRMVTFGAGLIIIMIWRPRGLISTREPSAFMFKPKRRFLSSRRSTRSAGAS